MNKQQVYKHELEKLNAIFQDVEPSKAKLVQGLIEDAAFLLAENYKLRQVISDIGMIKVHPKHRDIQKSTEAAKQYLKNVNSYAVVIKTLNGVLNKGIIEDPDELSEFE